jgi:copper transport protein
MRRNGRVARTVWRHVLLATALGLLLLVAVGVPLGPLSHLTPTASAHAVLVRSEPQADAILHAPPSQVRLWFSESINPFTSKVVVVDPTNHEVDRGDSHRNPSNDQEMDVSLPLLPAGTYIVDWRTQSEVDGHIVGGSFIFRIARPDGTVPPVPKVLPTGHFPGAAGSGVPSGNSIDAPTAVQGLGTFLALLLMTFWVGGVIWETWILPPNGARDPDLMRAARRSARRFARLAPYALGGVIVADVLMILGQSAELAGTWQGAVSPALLGAILFGSNFGMFWWSREVVALAALLLAIKMLRHEGSRSAQGALTLLPPRQVALTYEVPDWRRELLATVRAVRHLPRRLVRGWRGRSGMGQIECLLAGALLVAFALSGHAAAVPAKEFLYAITVDLLHLLCQAAWVGGLFYIGVVLIPALHAPRIPASADQDSGAPGDHRDDALTNGHAMDESTGAIADTAPLDVATPLGRARVLALGLPEFSAVAIVCAVTLAATGSLNTSIHLDSITQFLTTSYGRTLAIKIELFLVMVGISFYHAFILRPRLTRELNQMVTPSMSIPSATAVAREWLLIGAASVRGSGQQPADPVDSAPHSGGGEADLPPHIGRLADKLRDWLRREAILAGAVLLCVALLALFAGSLTPTIPASAAGASSGVYTQTQQSGGYSVALKVTPDAFGTNTFTVTLKDAKGSPVTGAAVVIEDTMLDMDMGTQTAQLKPVGASAPGEYSGQADLTMAGHWQVVVKVLLPNVKQPLSLTYKFSAGY